MTNNRTVSRIVAGVVVAVGLFVGATAPAQAFDTGWNGTRVAPTADTSK